jgi:uncharacterized LabA/DUF88 family protein
VNRTTFLVDGFNVYHSVRSASRDLGGQSTKWLDLRSLLASYLPAVGAQASLQAIYYFSALARHLDYHRPGVTRRHRTYLEALRATGVIPVMGRFKSKTVQCRRCRTTSTHYEEKETDVAISVKIVETFILDHADTVVLVTGDTDLAPAVRTSIRLFPERQVCFAFPYKRKNKELAQLASRSLLIRKERYAAHQLPDVVRLASGRVLRKPHEW